MIDIYDFAGGSVFYGLPPAAAADFLDIDMADMLWSIEEYGLCGVGELCAVATGSERPTKGE